MKNSKSLITTIPTVGADLVGAIFGALTSLGGGRSASSITTALKKLGGLAGNASMLGGIKVIAFLSFMAGKAAGFKRS